MRTFRFFSKFWVQTERMTPNAQENDENNNQETEPEYYKLVPPDGGYGYVISLGAALINVSSIFSKIPEF